MTKFNEIPPSSKAEPKTDYASLLERLNLCAGFGGTGTLERLCAEAADALVELQHRIAFYENKGKTNDV